MKSLLVDALRAANDNGDDGLSLEETIAPGRPTAPREEKPASAPEIDANLELLDNVDASADPEVAENDAHFEDEEALPTVSVDSKRVAPAAATATRFERATKWMPVVCVLLVAFSAAAFSGWSSVTSTGNNTLLGTQLGAGDSAPANNAPSIVAQTTRFEFIDDPRASASRSGRPNAGSSNTVRPPTAAISVVRSTTAERPRAVAGLTDADGANFSSITVIYRAFTSGQINQAALDRLLERAATSGRESTELEIKLLLQRYPDSASLHNALGTVLAKNARWPEARAAYERAAELAQAAPGGTLR